MAGQDSKDRAKSDLQQEVSQLALQVRRWDFLWAAGLAAGACVLFALLGGVSLWRTCLILLVFFAGLAMRYFILARQEPVHPAQVSMHNKLATYEKLRSVLNALPEPVVMMARDGTIEVANPATAAFFGSANEGRHISTLLRSDAVRSAVKKAREAGVSVSADFKIAGPPERFCRAFVTQLDEESMADLGQSRTVLAITDLTQEQRIDEMRSDFIANASHELRTPLASMLGFIETLKGHAKDDPAVQDKFLGIMENQAKRMQRLVEDLMSLSKIELDEFQPVSDKIDLGSVINDVKDSLAPLEEKYQGKIEIKVNPDNPVHLAGDRDQLIQLVQNLSDNALKYGGDKPTVQITLGAGDLPTLSDGMTRSGDTPAVIASRSNIVVEDLVWFQVRDHGAGLDRDVLPRLTERFYRVDVETSKLRGGTGLGLAIVKHIVNRHKGGLIVESGEGQGSVFSCIFPKFQPSTDENLQL